MSEGLTQTSDHVEEAVPHSEIATTVSDMPVDFGEPGVADWPDFAFGEADVDDDETPSEDEPTADDGEGDEAEDDIDEPLPDEDEEVEEPVLPPGIEEEQQEGQQ